MPTSRKTNHYYVQVEELVPRGHATYMLRLTENLERLQPVKAETAFKDLKRAMAWTERFVAPTTEFWEGTSDEFEISTDTTLIVQSLGFGWTIAVSSRKPVVGGDIGGEEKRLIGILDDLTRHIPVKAILRMKSTRWTKKQLTEVVNMFRIHDISCSARKFSLNFKDDFQIDVEPEERLRCNFVSRDIAKRVESVLALIKEYANRKYEGSDWCAYQRRRLTLVHKIGHEKANPADLRFVRHPEYGMEGEVISSHVSDNAEFSAQLFFFKSKYHLGNIHPRALVVTTEQGETLKQFSTYLYYLWNLFYTRIWLYLLFEDIYAYADRLRSSREYIDPKILLYWDSLLKTDDIIRELEIHEMVDKGVFRSYNPPHASFQEEDIPGIALSSVKPLDWLRHYLIEATTTQLEDPLKRALETLRKTDEGLRTTLNLFERTVDVGIQKTLHILQFLFVITAVGEVVHLLDLGNVLIEVLKHFGVLVPLIEPLPTTLADLLLVMVFSVIVLSLLRTAKVRHWIEHVIPSDLTRRSASRLQLVRDALGRIRRRIQRK